MLEPRWFSTIGVLVMGEQDIRHGVPHYRHRQLSPAAAAARSGRASAAASDNLRRS
jgi:hypothetical protein